MRASLCQILRLVWRSRRSRSIHTRLVDHDTVNVNVPWPGSGQLHKLFFVCRRFGHRGRDFEISPQRIRPVKRDQQM